MCKRIHHSGHLDQIPPKMVQVFIIAFLTNAVLASPLLKYEKELVKKGFDIKVLHEIAKASREVEEEFGTKEIRDEIASLRTNYEKAAINDQISDVLCEGDLELTPNNTCCTEAKGDHCTEQWRVATESDPFNPATRRQALTTLVRMWKPIGQPMIPYNFAPGYRKLDKRRCVFGEMAILLYIALERIQFKHVTDVCSSTIGMKGGIQNVNLGSGCQSVTVIAHEVSHAFGTLHVQSRSDRDEYVRIDIANIKEGKEHNFLKEPSTGYSTYDIPYEFGSMQHYPEKAFALNTTLPTIYATGNNAKYQYSMEGPRATFYDILLVNRMYQCTAKCQNTISCQNNGVQHGSECNKCFCPKGWTGTNCEMRPADAQVINVTSVKEVKVEIAASTGEFTEKLYVLQAPVGKKISANVTKLGEKYNNVCRSIGMEIIPFTDTRMSGYRFCSAPKQGPIISESNSMLIWAYNEKAYRFYANIAIMIMSSFWNLLCRIIVTSEGVIGLMLNVIVLVQLWKNNIRSGWSTYRIGMTIIAIHGAILSLLSAFSCLIHIFRFDNYLFVFYGPIIYLPRVYSDVALFILFALCIGIWQFTPASCLLQYLALCKSHLSERKRIALSYSLSITLMIAAMPYYTTFHAPPQQRPDFENITRVVHELNEEDVFNAYGALLFPTARYVKSILQCKITRKFKRKACIDFAIYAVLPSYFIAYLIFIWCCVMISKALGSFGVQLSQKTIGMQRSFLKMLLMQGLFPLILMSAPLGGFVTALITGVAMDKLTLLVSYHRTQNISMRPVKEKNPQNSRILQGAIELVYVNRMEISSSRDSRETSKMTKNSTSAKLSWSEWKRPLVAIVLTFLCNVESSMLAMGEWPYMSTIDPEATASFFGYATAANKAGHAISAFAFAIWAHKISGIKIPVLAARILTLVGCIMYFFVEFIPENRRIWMLFCYILFGVGFGTSPLLRSYIARVTSDDNRSTAYALQNGAMVMSVVVGPIAQLSFAGLPYPGAIIIPPNIKLNIFTAPICGLFNATITAIAGPMMTSMFAMSGQDIVLILVGVIALCLSVAFFVFKLGKRVSCRVLFAFSNIVVFLGYLLTYPFPFTSNPMQPYNATTRTGCNPLEYSWCDSQLVTNLILFMVVLTILSSFALPSAALSLDTIYSKIIGNIDQNVLQSMFVIADDIMMIAGPIYGSAIFTAIGINYLYIINGVIYILGTVVWLAAWRWLRPYK
uniref:Metalloendopeptidase n=1 Tax=Pristionchus pacificus TaxID=54126 RepID=A0A8R1YMS8_PRIPA